MNRRTLRSAAVLGALAFTLAAALPAGAQSQAQAGSAASAQPDPRARLAEVERILSRLSREYVEAEFELDAFDAFIRLGEAREADLREGRLVAVGEGTRVIYMDRSAFNRSLLRHVTQGIVNRAAREGSLEALGMAADAAFLREMVRPLEAELLILSERHRQALAATLAQVRSRRNDLQSLMSRTTKSAHDLLDEWLDQRDQLMRAHAGELPSSPWPDNSPTYPAGLKEAKEAAGQKLETIRLANRWSADDHYKCGTLVGLARTRQELTEVERLIGEYDACYSVKNGKQAAVAAKARAGEYLTPGDRIGELNEIATEFNACHAKADANFQQARARR